MNSEKIRQLFLDFFKERGHTVVPSSSLISDDPSVLFTTAGMQQFKPYYLSEKSPYGKNVVSIQKCFRTSDIDSVGDESHLTFFEMLGNFSFGGYFKEDAIKYAYEFITGKEWMNLEIDYVTVFDPAKVPKGDWRKNDVPFDQESYKTWKTIGIPEERIKREGLDTFWGPTGDEGPCGPTTEIYVKNIRGKSIEVWNIVFNEFYCDKGKKLTPLKASGVDTGLGLERLAMMVQKKPTIFETDLFEPLIDAIPLQPDDIKIKRVLADHIRAAIYLIADGVEPSNKDRGYILRRLLRRIAVNIGKEASIPLSQSQREQPLKSWNERTYQIIKSLKNKLIELDEDLQSKDEIIDSTIRKETEKFIDLLKSGSELEEIIKKYENSKDKKIPGKEVFRLYSSLGIPIDYIKDEIKKYRLSIDEKEFEEERKKHQEISRAGLDKKFGGHGLKENGEITGAIKEEKQKITRLHTATHLLHQALGDLFGNQIKQMGSDINPERLRFDFPFERKLTTEEIVKIENTVNQKIKESLPVKFEEKPKEKAIAEGAKAFFKVKYPDKVKVYSIGPSTNSGQAYSKEICNGPHVGNTSEIGRFKILKEESVGVGVRRIRATVE